MHEIGSHLLPRALALWPGSVKQTHPGFTINHTYGYRMSRPSPVGSPNSRLLTTTQLVLRTPSDLQWEIVCAKTVTGERKWWNWKLPVAGQVDRIGAERSICTN